jgi:hypothetical protein
MNYSGIDFDDKDYGFKEEDKSQTKVCTKLVVLDVSTHRISERQ